MAAKLLCNIKLSSNRYDPIEDTETNHLLENFLRAKRGVT